LGATRRSERERGRSSRHWQHGTGGAESTDSLEVPMNRAIALLLALAAMNVSAQGWPAKPLRAVVPVGAGRSTGIVHRVVLEPVSEQLGQPSNALQAPKVGEQLAGLGLDAMPMSPDEFTALVTKEVGVNAGLARKAGLKAE
jgi:tripartite-type tricarboxylate transporter receptor subunit TctC